MTESGYLLCKSSLVLLFWVEPLCFSCLFVWIL